MVIKEIAKAAGVAVEWHYHQTTIDPPELYRFIREKHPDVIIDKPKMNFFQRMIEKAHFPTRTKRWCCQEYKEKRYPGRSVIVGVRTAESLRRKERWTSCVVNHVKTNQKYVLPIRLWPNGAVWQTIFDRKIPHCSLYDEGFTRLGCIGCPMTTHKQREIEFSRWPGYKKQWERAFKEIWEKKHGTMQKNGKEWFGSARFDRWETMFEWWNSGARDIDKFLNEKKQTELMVIS